MNLAVKRNRASVSLAFASLALAAVVGCNGGSSAPAAGETKPTDAPSTTSSSTTTGAKRPATTAPAVKVAGDKIKIGLVASISGTEKPWGDDSVAGAQIAVEELNKAGGIQGKQIELEVQDSASSPEGAKTAAEKLLSDGVIAIIGEVSSGNTIQIAKSAFEKSVPVIGIGSTKPDLTDIGNNVFRVCYSDDFQGPVMANFAFKELGLKKVALMTDNKAPYSQGLSKSFSESFKKLGGEVIDEQKYDKGDKQFNGQVNELKSKNPDGIFLSGYFAEVGPIAAALRAAGIKAKLMGGDGWDSPKLLESGGDAIIGGFMCNHYTNASKDKVVLDFLAKWKPKHGGQDPTTTMAALGYDAAALTFDALKRAKGLDSLSLRDALDETENYGGVSGTITLKGHNGTPFKPALVMEIKSMKDGFQVPVKPYTPNDIK